MYLAVPYCHKIQKDQKEERKKILDMGQWKEIIKGRENIACFELGQKKELNKKRGLSRTITILKLNK